MKFEKYASIEAFIGETLDVLLENEAQNNLPIGLVQDKAADASDWLLASVKAADGGVALVAVCTPPHNIILYETGNRPNADAVKRLVAELRGMGYALPGVLAEQGLARRFADTYAAGGGFCRHLSMNIMRLDKVNAIEKAPGACRPLREADLFFVPYWERLFGEECRTDVPDIQARAEQLKKRLGKDTHYIWEDGHPVSQAVCGRATRNGAVVNSVYTPPHFRGRGYASSVVAELSGSLLRHGHKFCCLFADAENPVSCGIYRKIGYRDLCVFDELCFGMAKNDGTA